MYTILIILFLSFLGFWILQCLLLLQSLLRLRHGFLVFRLLDLSRLPLPCLFLQSGHLCLLQLQRLLRFCHGCLVFRLHFRPLCSNSFFRCTKGLLLLRRRGARLGTGLRWRRG